MGQYDSRERFPWVAKRDHRDPWGHRGLRVLRELPAPRVLKVPLVSQVPLAPKVTLELPVQLAQ